jgi:hypothetical protein
VTHRGDVMCAVGNTAGGKARLYAARSSGRMFMRYISCLSTLILLTIGCGSGGTSTSDQAGSAGSGGSGGAGGGGTSGSMSTSSDVSTSSGSTSSGATCSPVGQVCGSGASAKCGSRQDSCGNTVSCTCPPLQSCTGSELCCSNPADYGKGPDATAECAKHAGFPTPAYCGEVPKIDESGSPIVDADGVPVLPDSVVPDYCVRARYLSGVSYSLWCCK